MYFCIDALRSSWGRIYVRTSCLISARYEIISDLDFFFLWPIDGDGLEDDRVLFQYRDRVYYIASILGAKP